MSGISELKDKRAQSLLGGGEKRIESQHKKGKLTARERLHFTKVLLKRLVHSLPIEVANLVLINRLF